MLNLDEFIQECDDVRELKRALSVKMAEAGVQGTTISELLQVSPQYVSKWKGMYQTGGVAALSLGYGGSAGYLNEEQRQKVVSWIEEHLSLSVEELRDYLEASYGVTYQSKQSYYALLEAGGMSYHKTEKVNPKRDEAQVQAQQDLIKKNWRRSGMLSNGAR